MKNFLLIVLLFVSAISLQAQTQEKEVKISGKLNVSINEEAGGINVYNISNGRYTYTDDYGKFSIHVKQGDELVFSSIQFQQFSVIITQSVIDKKELNIDVSTQSNVLDEVIVKPNLTGNVRVDLKKVQTRDINYSDPNLKEIIYGYNDRFSRDQFTSPENAAIDKGYLQNGINFAYIIKSILGIKAKGKESRPDYMDVQIRKLYNDEFFVKYLDIKEEKINEFVYFMEDRGLNVEKIRSLNDLELIQYVIAESEVYNQQKE